MRRQELIKALEQSRQAFEKLIDELSHEELNDIKVDQWSVKDIISHLSLWEAESVTLLYQARQGMTPTTLHLRPFDDDEVNAEFYERTSERSLEQALDDFRGVRRQLLRRLAEFSDKELERTGFFPWQPKNSLANLIWEYTGEHEEEHTRTLREQLSGLEDHAT